jgi:hypothetical protein
VGGLQPEENVDHTNSKKLRAEKLADLVGPTSMKTLNILGFDSIFLISLNPEYWTTFVGFSKMKAQMASIKGVNDASERAIAMMSGQNG